MLSKKYYEMFAKVFYGFDMELEEKMALKQLAEALAENVQHLKFSLARTRRSTTILKAVARYLQYPAEFDAQQTKDLLDAVYGWIADIELGHK